MKRQILFVLVLLTIASCDLEEEPLTELVELSAPDGFKITHVNTINTDSHLEQLQMIDDHEGYILRTDPDSQGYVDMLKTLDGGKSWYDLEVQLQGGLRVRGFAESMHFLNTEIGVVSYKVGDKVNILWTSSGGGNWRQLIFVEFNGAIEQLQQDEDENLYAMVRGLDEPTMLLKSSDKGLSWDSLYASQDLHFRYSTFDFQVYQNKIYVPGPGGKVVVLDKDGHHIHTITTHLAGIWGLSILDENNVIAFGTDEVIKSTDGGENWQEIYDKPAKMIGYTSSGEALMILNKEHLPNESNDVFAATINGCESWLEASESYLNLKYDLINSQRFGDNYYLMLIGQELYEIREH